VQDKEENRIHKQDWKARTELEYELGATNVVYMLYDSKTKLVYLGEADNLVKRLLQPHLSIPEWDFFRYNVLPGTLAPYRIAIERMIIRDFAAILDNKREIPWPDLAGCCLANDKIDR
jgi:hypothetical protein